MFRGYSARFRKRLIYAPWRRWSDRRDPCGPTAATLLGWVDFIYKTICSSGNIIENYPFLEPGQIALELVGSRVKLINAPMEGAETSSNLYDVVLDIVQVKL